jgi:hypothetical protein
METNRKVVITLASLVGGFAASAALAEQKWLPPQEIAPRSAAATPAAPAVAAPTVTPVKPATIVEDKKAKAKDCSAQADAKGLHGKERKKFKEECGKS